MSGFTYIKFSFLEEYFFYEKIYIEQYVPIGILTRETAPSKTSDMGKKTVSVLAPSFLLP